MDEKENRFFFSLSLFFFFVWQALILSFDATRTGLALSEKISSPPRPWQRLIIKLPDSPYIARHCHDKERPASWSKNKRGVELHRLGTCHPVRARERPRVFSSLPPWSFSLIAYVLECSSAARQSKSGRHAPSIDRWRIGIRGTERDMHPSP